MSQPFKVRLSDPGITALASESAFDWAGDQVAFALSDNSQLVRDKHEGKGVFAVMSGKAASATVTAARRVGPHRQPVRWRLASGEPAILRPGVEQELGLSTRLRMSLWTMGAPFIKKLSGSGVVLDQPLLKLLKEARIDDLSLVHTITFDHTRPPRLKWAESFKPAALGTLREPYCRALLQALHAIDVQVLAGYVIVESGSKSSDEGQAFNRWLASASAREVEDHAAAIDAFFADRGLGFDGIGFDFEINGLGDKQRDNLALLYRATAEVMAHRNGMVTYANAPFQADGVNQNSFMKVQPFALTLQAPNLVARPMCFDDKNSSTFDEVKKSVECALRKPDDNKGAGVHPAQVQFALWADKIGDSQMVRWCQELLRPNRMGLMLYTLPPKRENAERFLKQCVRLDSALNPDEGPPGREGQPLQVPRGFGSPPLTTVKPSRLP